MVADNPALNEARLRGLVRDIAGAELEQVDPLLGAGRAGDRGFFVVEDDPRAIGRALHWAGSNALTSIDVLALNDAADLARRASFVSGSTFVPDLTVWAVDGAEATLAEPRPAPDPPDLPPAHWALAGVMTEAGALPVDDHGVLVAEVAGLEVGRVVESDGVATIELGVGQADRELNQLVHRELDIGAGLRRVIGATVGYRSGHVHHPLTRFARERWLRSMLLDDPSLVDATDLEPVVPLRPRKGLLATQPAAAAGHLTSGRPVVVVTMVGIDLDLVPEAADYRHRCDPDAELRLVTPRRDVALNTTLTPRVDDVQVVALDGPWVG